MVDTYSDVPQAAQIISNTQDPIRQNFLYLKTMLGTDHIANTTDVAPTGFHSLVRFQKQTVPPAPATGSTVEVYSQDVTYLAITEPQVFFQTVSGKIAQLTSSVTPVTANPGITFLPGNLILAFGTQFAGGGNPPYTVKYLSGTFSFTNPPFAVFVTALNTGAQRKVSVTGVTNSQFIANFDGGPADVSYMAIGF